MSHSVKNMLPWVLVPLLPLGMLRCTGLDAGGDDTHDAAASEDARTHRDAAPESAADIGGPEAALGDTHEEYYGYDSAAWDAAQDSYADAAAPDLPPDAPADAADEHEPEPDDVCLLEITEPQVHYLSADDSNSQASPIIARKLIHDGFLVPDRIVRTYEFLNYYGFDYTPAERGRVSVSAQASRVAGDEDMYNLQIGVGSHRLDVDEARTMNLTFILDTSGSMSGEPMELLKTVCREIAGNLREGDVVSMVTWNTSRNRILVSHAVSGPDDLWLLRVVDRLSAAGGTDLDAGLEDGYELALAGYDPGRLNRAVLISDGQANVGVTSAELIAEHADDSEAEGIYLVGVGVGEGYNDTLMNAVTDAGKGAYVFIDSHEEASRIFGGRMLQVLEIAVMDVQVELTLPPVFRMEIFHGEEISGDPKEVEPQHLAPNDAMIFHQTLRMCGPAADEDMVTVRAFFTDPETRHREHETLEVSLPALLARTGDEILKGDAVVAYAEGLKEIYAAMRSGDDEGAASLCRAVRDEVNEAAVGIGDFELYGIVALLDLYCPTLPGRAETPWH